MKLCSRFFVLYCRSRPKDDKSRHFDPHFEEVNGGVGPCEFVSVIGLLFLSLTVEALQGKRCPDSLLSGGGRSVRAKISGEEVVPGEYFLVSTKLDAFCYRHCKNCTMLRAVVLTQYRRVTDRRTDRRTDKTDGTAVASTALAMRTLRRAVKRTGQEKVTKWLYFTYLGRSTH